MFLLVQLKNQTKVNGYFFESLSMTINFFKNLIAMYVHTSQFAPRPAQLFYGIQYISESYRGIECYCPILNWCLPAISCQAMLYFFHLLPLLCQIFSHFFFSRKTAFFLWLRQQQSRKIAMQQQAFVDLEEFQSTFYCTKLCLIEYFM